ncbi:MAG: branched-chain amino acid aminotransferase [Bradyrhizobiaceae bacterium]|nr:branched-chain amino acid aminotransferase [Bradyrhizobiaceae bacterium]
MQIPIDRTTSPRLDHEAVLAGKLTNVPSDHMVVAEYAHGEWRKARVQPYRPIPLAPFSIVLHYAQTVFEGMKAYRGVDDVLRVFRWQKHHARLQKSMHRMCMPEMPEELFKSAIHELVAVDHGWVPRGPDSAYYLRPFVFASEEHVGLKPAEQFTFIVLGAPFRPLFKSRMSIKVEREYVRASPGGTGFAKCGGNYAAAMLPTKMAKDAGYDQVLWTDAHTHTHVEESGATNIAFVVKGALVTPPLSDTILDGVTRDSVITLARELGIEVQERPLSIDEITHGIHDGSVTEAFGIGTAASVAAIGKIGIDGVDYELPVVAESVAGRLRDSLNAIRFGQVADPYGWMTTVDPL